MKLSLAKLVLAASLPCVSFTFCESQNVSALHSDKHTATPIKHLVIIYGENISFDHYFGTYPNAANLSGERPFHAVAGTPSVNGLKGALLTSNPNLNAANGAGATNPIRLSPAQAWTASQNHDYMPEQMAFDKGLMDL